MSSINKLPMKPTMTRGEGVSASHFSHLQIRIERLMTKGASYLDKEYQYLIITNSSHIVI